MKQIWLVYFCLLCLAWPCFAGQPAPRYAVAQSPTPVLNTPEIAAVFGKTLRTDSCGQLRAMEFVALPGTVFTIEAVVTKGTLTLYRVTSADYPYPRQSGYFIDSRFVRVTEKKPPERTRQLPPKETVIDNLLAAKGSRYVWGGNCRNGLPGMLSLYPPAESASLTPDTAALRQLRGVDCSGLLYEATNGFTPRNTSALSGYGKAVGIAGLGAERIIERVEPLDLIVWQGHVIIILDRELTIESRLDCGGTKGGVVVRPLRETLAGVMQGRVALNDLGDAGERGKKGFVIRRWYAGYPSAPF
jgi:hypothetical protein